MKNINAKEILEIAIQNEKNGVVFYTKLAGRVNDDSVKKTLLEFADQEGRHVVAVKKLINKLMEENEELAYYDDPEELLYLQAIADASIFTDVHDSAQINAIISDTLAAFHYAVNVEVKSIEFYKQLLQIMSPDSDQDTVKELIEQEKGHVRTLYTMIKGHEE